MSKDGGPAFPATKYVEPSPHTTGMSLRDYFAAAALPAFLGTHGNHWTGGTESPDTWRVLVGRAYDAADAMLAEREKS